MLRKKCLCKAHKVGNDLVVPVRPIGGKLKAVGGFLSALSACALVLFDVACPGGVGIISKRSRMETMRCCSSTEGMAIIIFSNAILGKRGILAFLTFDAMSAFFF